MTEVKSFYSHHAFWKDSYDDINEQINDYVKEHDIFIKEIHYDRFENGHSVVANVLFTDIPNELYVL